LLGGLAPKPVWHYPWHYGFAKKNKSIAKKIHAKEYRILNIKNI
jgi:hypothetical protein